MTPSARQLTHGRGRFTATPAAIKTIKTITTVTTVTTIIAFVVAVTLPAIFVLSCAGSPDASTAREPDLSTPAGSMVPFWSDEFDGPAINRQKWYVLDRHDRYWPETPWRRNYKSSNAFIENGALVLRTVADGTGYSAACLATKDDGKPALFEGRYGSYEARIRFPKAPGHWCAFWLMYSTDGENGILGEKRGGRDGTEVDIMEKAWLGDKIVHNLHWDGYGSRHRSAGREVTGKGMDDGNWHVFRLEWYPNVYVFSVDGVETWRTAAGGVCREPLRIILSEEIGNFGTGPDAWGSGPIEASRLPDRFEIDYVRVCRFVPSK